MGSKILGKSMLGVAFSPWFMERPEVMIYKENA